MTSKNKFRRFLVKKPRRSEKKIRRKVLPLYRSTCLPRRRRSDCGGGGGDPHFFFATTGGFESLTRKGPCHTFIRRRFVLAQRIPPGSYCQVHGITIPLRGLVYSAAKLKQQRNKQTRKRSRKRTGARVTRESNPEPLPPQKKKPPRTRIIVALPARWPRHTPHRGSARFVHAPSRGARISLPRS